MPRSEPEAAGTHDTLRIARVAVEGAPLHLGDSLDYLPSDEDLEPGHRVEVTLAGRKTRGLVVGISDRTDVAPSRLRQVGRRLGDVPWLDADAIALLGWAAERFGAPLGDVVRHALPNRIIDEERRASSAGWWPPDRGASTTRVASEPDALEERLATYGEAGAVLGSSLRDGAGSFLLTPAPGEDLADLVASLARRTLAHGRTVLIVVPGPVSDVADRVLAEVLPEDRVDLRGGPTPRMFYRGWLRARAGLVRVVVGERSAVFTPLHDLGLAVIVDEADPTHKERRSPRHHAREVVLERARRAEAVGLCLADVPSAVARSLMAGGRLRRVAPSRSTIEGRRPLVHLESGELEARTRISRAGIRVLKEATRAGGYGVVLAARRGEGRTLVCGRCGDLVRCTTCGASVARNEVGGWWCAGCGTTSPRAPRCERCGPGRLSPLAAGAERLGEELARASDAPVVVLEGHAPPVPPAPAILVMTRGSVLDRPPPGGLVLGVVLPDLDGSLRRPTLDAAEDALRLAFRVAGWTAMQRLDGSTAEGVRPAPAVVVETRDPEHHALRALVAWDADAFWEAEEAIRTPLGLPPVRRAIRVEFDGAAGLVEPIRASLPPGDSLIGPLPLERGRLATVILSDDRSRSLVALRPLRDELSRRGVDLRVDVDPVDLG